MTEAKRLSDGWHKVGTIGVDAGCVMVGDPCYTVGTEAVQSWDEFLRRTWPVEFDGGSEGQSCYDHASKALGKDGMGIVVPSGYGDGEYPVSIRVAHGRVAELKVDFLVDTNDDEEE